MENNMENFYELPFAQQHRLHFIEIMLKHAGEVTRASVADMFGVGVATATRDITLYRKLFPHQITLNRKTGRWSRAVSFDSILTNGDL